MKRKNVFKFVLFLVFSLVLVPFLNADCIELKYDDGTAEIGTSNAEGTQFGVKFTLSAMSARLVKARFYIWDFVQTFVVHVYDLNGNDLIQPILFGAYSSTGWVDVPLNVMVSDDFIIALELFDDAKPYIGTDWTLIQGHSYQRTNPSHPWHLNVDDNWMIRAVICIPPPVGGEILLNNVTKIGTLIIAVTSTTAIIAGIVFKKRKLI